MHEVLVGLQSESILSRFAYAGSSLKVENSHIVRRYFGYKGNLKCSVLKCFGQLPFGMVLSVPQTPVWNLRRPCLPEVWFRSERMGSFWVVSPWGAEVDGTVRQLFAMLVMLSLN